MGIIKLFIFLVFALWVDFNTGALTLKVVHKMVEKDLAKGHTSMSDMVRKFRGGRDLPQSWLRELPPGEGKVLPKVRCPRSACPHRFKGSNPFL